MQRIFGAIMFLLAAGAVNAAVPAGSLLDGVKPGPDGKIDVVTIFPHPDDEVAYSGGTLIKLKQDPRVRLHILCMTLGDLSPAKDTLKITPEKMAQIRSAELKSVGAVVNADEIVQWDYHDQGLLKVDPKELSSRILDFLNQSGAEVVIGYGPDGVSGHVDHVVGYQRVLEAFKNSHAQKLYYVNVPKAVYPVYYLSRQILYMYDPKWFPGKGKPLPATVKVDIRCCRKMKLLSLDEHASQKFFMTAIDKLEFSVIYNYEYFALAESNN